MDEYTAADSDKKTTIWGFCYRSTVIFSKEIRGLDKYCKKERGVVIRGVFQLLSRRLSTNV